MFNKALNTVTSNLGLQHHVQKVLVKFGHYLSDDNMLLSFKLWGFCTHIALRTFMGGPFRKPETPWMLLRCDVCIAFLSAFSQFLRTTLDICNKAKESQV